MFLRLPWILSRKRLLGAVLLDAVIFSSVYIIAFELRFGVWPGLSLPVAGMVGFWLTTSYVIGRYHALGSGNAAQAINMIARAMATLLMAVGVYLAYFWVTAATLGVKDSRGFLIPLLFVFALLSCLAQAFYSRLVPSSSRQSQEWLLVDFGGVFCDLENYLEWKRLHAKVSAFSGDFLALQASDPSRYAGLLVADFSRLSDSFQKQLLSLQQNGWLVYSLVGWCERVLQRFPPELLTNADLLRGDFSLSKDTIQLRLKRLGDVIVSGVLLVITAPVILIVAVLIRWQDGGPVFYSQLRSGLDGEPFRVWKLRTMRVNAELYGAQWAGKGDPRITPLGRILRLTRLDELPQLWSVLQGEMSLIGPRPERPEFEDNLEQQIPHYRLRHLMRPGLSGWAQVNYPYGASLEDAANKLSYDLYYLRNFSVLLDILILFKTIRLVFNAEGAIPVEPVSNSGP
jgi:exopolysaccharide biosynthesis polyprenyl glycosylphosphotransferase